MKANQILCYGEVNCTDADKVAEIAESIKANGWCGAPILVSASMGRLITGSHRLVALRMLDADVEWYGSLDDLGDVAEDVDDILEAWCRENDACIDDIDFSFLAPVFAGTWVEEYKEEIVEW